MHACLCVACTAAFSLLCACACEEERGAVACVRVLYVPAIYVCAMYVLAMHVRAMYVLAMYVYAMYLLAMKVCVPCKCVCHVYYKLVKNAQIVPRILY